MGVEIKKVEGGKDLKAFMKVPWMIYKDDPTWAPDLIMDLKDRLNRKKHPFFLQGEAEFFLALKDGEVVGRIAAIINNDHNKYWKEKTGFFGFFECIDNQEVANKLFDTAKEWVKAKGMNKLRGPMSCSTNDVVGMEIETDGSHAMVVMPYNPKYYVKLCEKYGFYKAKDLVCFKLDIENAINPKVLRIADSLRSRAEHKGLTIRHLNRKQLKRDLRLMLDIYSEAWAKNWGFVPMSQAEFDTMADTLNMITDPKLVTIIEKNGEPVGFAVAVYDLMELTHSLNHLKDKPLWYQSLRQILRLVNWLFLSRKNKFTRGRLLLAGVKTGYRQLGFDSLLYTIPFEEGKKLGVKTAELSWELEDNTAIISGIEKMGGKVYKKNRVWDIDIK